MIAETTEEEISTEEVTGDYAETDTHTDTDTDTDTDTITSPATPATPATPKTVEPEVKTPNSVEEELAKFDNYKLTDFIWGIDDKGNKKDITQT